MLGDRVELYASLTQVVEHADQITQASG